MYLQRTGELAGVKNHLHIWRPEIWREVMNKGNKCSPFRHQYKTLEYEEIEERQRITALKAKGTTRLNSLCKCVS